jgi:hypothetical protein
MGLRRRLISAASAHPQRTPFFEQVFRRSRRIIADLRLGGEFPDRATPFEPLLPAVQAAPPLLNLVHRHLISRAPL